MYSYRFRPGYGSDKFLIEFVKGVEKETFLTDLKEALSQIEIEIGEVEDLWMNDEVLLHVNSSEGKFLLSKDVWNCAFIMADVNQKCVTTINQILCKNDQFKSEEVGYSEYK